MGSLLTGTLYTRQVVEIWIFTELFVWFDIGATNNLDDGLLISLAVTCDQQRSDTHCWLCDPLNG